jgi:hypothetical protein
MRRGRRARRVGGGLSVAVGVLLTGACDDGLFFDPQPAPTTVLSVAYTFDMESAGSTLDSEVLAKADSAWVFVVSGDFDFETGEGTDFTLEADEVLPIITIDGQTGVRLEADINTEASQFVIAVQPFIHRTEPLFIGGDTISGEGAETRRVTIDLLPIPGGVIAEGPDNPPPLFVDFQLDAQVLYATGDTIELEGIPASEFLVQWFALDPGVVILDPRGIAQLTQPGPQRVMAEVYYSEDWPIPPLGSSVNLVFRDTVTVSAVDACAPTPLRTGEDVEGIYNPGPGTCAEWAFPDHPVDVYELNVTEAGFHQFQLTSGAFEPWVVVFRPDGTMADFTDSRGFTTSTAGASQMQLGAGTHRVTVGRYFPTDPSGVGAYTLRVDPTGESPPFPQNTGCYSVRYWLAGGDANPGYQYGGPIDEHSCEFEDPSSPGTLLRQDSRSLWLRAGETITVTSNSRDFMPTLSLELFAGEAGGMVVEPTYTEPYNPDGGNAYFTYTPPVTGRYQLHSTATPGIQTGVYGIRVFNGPWPDPCGSIGLLGEDEVTEISGSTDPYACVFGEAGTLQDWYDLDPSPNSSDQSALRVTMKFDGPGPHPSTGSINPDLPRATQVVAFANSDPDSAQYVMLTPAGYRMLRAWVGGKNPGEFGGYTVRSEVVSEDNNVPSCEETFFVIPGVIDSPQQVTSADCLGPGSRNYLDMFNIKLTAGRQYEARFKHPEGPVVDPVVLGFAGSPPDVVREDLPGDEIRLLVTVPQSGWYRVIAYGRDFTETGVVDRFGPYTFSFTEIGPAPSATTVAAPPLDASDRVVQPHSAIQPVDPVSIRRN